MKEKNLRAWKIQKAFYKHKKLQQLHRIFNGIRRIQDLWRCRMEYANFKKTKMRIRMLQAFFHKKFLQKQAKDYRQYCIKLQKYFRRYKDYKLYLSAKINIIRIQKLIRGYLGRLRARKFRYCREIVLKSLVFPAVNIVMQKNAIKIQKIARGYITKCKNFEIVVKARFVKKNLMEIKATRKIQKIARGYIVRQRLNRLNRAAFFIQGHFRMKWLTALVKRLRKAAKIIQRNVRIFINRKKAIKSRIDGFLESHYSNFEDLTKKEKNHLFYNNEEVNNNGSDGGSSIELEEGYLLGNVKEVAPYDSKIQLFTFIFDIDFMVYIIIYL